MGVMRAPLTPPSYSPALHVFISAPSWEICNLKEAISAAAAAARVGPALFVLGPTLAVHLPAGNDEKIRMHGGWGRRAVGLRVEQDVRNESPNWHICFN